MAKKFRSKSTYIACILAATVAVGACGYIGGVTKANAASQTSVEKTQVVKEQTEQNEKYLDLYFGMNNIPNEITGDFLVEALNKVSDNALEGYEIKDELTYGQAIKLAVKAAHFEELSLGYSQEKIEGKNISEEINEEDRAYIACAVDTNLITQEALDYVQESITKEQAINLLMAVADANGKGRHYLGYTNEADIYGKILKAKEEAVLFENDKLQAIGEQAVMNGVTTGYNLLNKNYSANFIPELTLRYGHSTMIHALQLIGLLNSEGIVAKVQLEPKTSIFEYLPEWGEVPPATPDYRVEVVNDNLMLAQSLEYDLVFEFETVDDKIRFDTLINTYAKLDDENPEGEGMLLASWWQPLYVSSTEMEEGYKVIYNNVITDGDYTLNPFCLEGDKEKVLEDLQAIDPSIEVEQIKIWCNDAFYRYLSGESHQ